MELSRIYSKDFDKRVSLAGIVIKTEKVDAQINRITLVDANGRNLIIGTTSYSGMEFYEISRPKKKVWTAIGSIGGLGFERAFDSEDEARKFRQGMIDRIQGPDEILELEESEVDA